MDTERIREFIVLANTCNFQVASDALFTTSSTLSKHIAQIEQELGVSLFDRSTRKVALTDAGKLFLESAKEVIYHYDLGLSAVRSLSSEREGELTIAFLEVMRQYNVFQVIHEFNELHRDLRINLIESEAQAMNSLLHLGACDFAFASRMEFFGRDVERVFYDDDELVIIVPKSHPLAKRREVHLEELRDEQFVIHQSYYEGDIFTQTCRDHGFTIKPMLTSANSSTVIDVVSNSMAISVLSRKRCMTHANITRVATVSLQPRIGFTVYLLYLRSKSLTPAMRAFIRHIEEINAQKGFQNSET